MKIFYKILTIAPILFLSACSKDKLTPNLGLNSNLKLKNIKLAGFTGNSSTAITGYANFTFVKPNESNNAILDTIQVLDTFSLPTTNGYDENFNFTTPANSKYLNVDLSFYITDGTATAITLDNISMDYNGKTYLNSGAQNCETTNNADFDIPTITINY